MVMSSFPKLSAESQSKLAASMKWLSGSWDIG